MSVYDGTTKQTPSPYITFCTLKRTEVKSIFPEANFGEMGRILGSLWSAMGDEGRSEFGRVAQELATKSDPQKQLWMEKCKLPTAFSLFCDEHRLVIRSTVIAGASHVDIIKTFTAEWCILSPERRQDYIKHAEEMEHASSLVKRRRVHVKHTPSAYMVFASEKRQELATTHPGITFSEVGKILGQLWGELNEEGKTVCYFH